MVLPFMFIFVLFTVVPVVASLFLSFTQFNMLEAPKFIFMDNYITLFLDDELFITALKNTLIFYAPSIAGNAYLIWTTLFSSDAYGWANAILMELGIIDTPILWFQNATYVMPLCIIVALWMSLGTAFLSFIAGLQGINKSLYEAGAIDGIKNRWQELWYITLPSMKPQLMFGAILAITGAFGFGPVVTALAGNPSVDYVAYTLNHHLSEYQGTRWEVGYASAISFIMFLMMIGANMLITKLISKVGQ